MRVPLPPGPGSIVRLPHRLLELGSALWHVRESLTVCGDPAKSKVWFTASLIAWRGAPTDLVPLTRSDLDSARDHLDRFMAGALESLVGYYLQTRHMAPLPLLAVAPLCCLQFAALLAIEFPDAAGDTAAGKHTLVEKSIALEVTWDHAIERLLA